MSDIVAGREKPLRVAVVGCGAVAERYHLPALVASPDVEVTALVDPSVERASTLARRANAAHTLSSHRELAGHIDLAVVAVPNALHESIACDLLAAGVHVLVEKPMARTVAECDRMIAAAAAAQTVLAVGHDFRFFPVARFARDWFAAAPLGPIRRIDVRQSAASRWPSVVPDVLSRKAGGGALITFGIHIVDLLHWWFGDLRVMAYRDDAEGGVEAEVECEFALENGAPVLLELSWLRSMRDTFIVECARGSVEIGIHEPAVVRVSVGGGSSALIGNVPDPAFERAPLRTVFGRQLENVVAAVRGTQGPLIGGLEGRAAVAVVEDCYAMRRPLSRPWDYPQAYSGVRETSH
jgi:predicted dehydrogenase